MKNLYNSLKELVKNTIVTGALVGTLIGGFGSYKHESNREGHIPVGFSEIREIEKNASRDGLELGPGTQFYSKTNDIVMKIFESSNIAHKRTSIGSYIDSFGTELDMRMDGSFKQFHYEIPDLLRDLPGYAQELLDEMQPFVQVMNRLNPVNSSFSKSWDDSHIDTTHTETYTYSCGDSKNPQTCTGYREVYDYTTHTYDYDKSEGDKASSLLDRLVSDYDKLEFNERFRVSDVTHTENEDAMERSRSDTERLGSEEQLKIANTWYTGCTLRSNMPHIVGLWDSMHSDNSKWKSAKESAQDEEYITYSHDDSGPAEFQVAETTLEHGTDLNSRIYEIVKGIEYVQRTAPHLDRLIREFVAVNKNFKDGDSDKLAEEIMDTAKSMYSMNFKNGFDVQGFRGYMPFLFGILGGVSGAGINIGINALMQRRRNRKYYLE